MMILIQLQVASSIHSLISNVKFDSAKDFNETYESERFANMKRYGGPHHHLR